LLKSFLCSWRTNPSISNSKRVAITSEEFKPVSSTMSAVRAALVKRDQPETRQLNLFVARLILFAVFREILSSD